MKKKYLFIPLLLVLIPIALFLLSKYYCSTLTDTECGDSFICHERLVPTGSNGGIDSLGLIYEGCKINLFLQ